MNNKPSEFTALLAILLWLAGMVLAQGFWVTVVAVLFPPYAWYLVVERALVIIGWVGG